MRSVRAVGVDNKRKIKTKLEKRKVFMQECSQTFGLALEFAWGEEGTGLFMHEEKRERNDM